MWLRSSTVVCRLLRLLTDRAAMRGQLIVGVKPGNPAFSKDMLLRWKPRGIVQGCGVDAHLAGRLGIDEHHVAAAAAAELPLGGCRGRVGRGLTSSTQRPALRCSSGTCGNDNSRCQAAATQRGTAPRRTGNRPRDSSYAHPSRPNANHNRDRMRILARSSTSARAGSALRRRSRPRARRSARELQD